MTQPRPEQLLDYAAQRAKVRPDYLGWVLARHIDWERISEADLATRLGISPHDLPRLALCLRPRAEHFVDDIRQISSKFHIEAATLAEIVRRVESLETLAATNRTRLSAEGGLLMAARARQQAPQNLDNERHEHDSGEP